jgi:hypothetical protein
VTGHTHDERSGPTQAGAPNGATINNMESSKLLPWLMMCAILSGFAVTAAIGAIIWTAMSARETKQLQIQVMDQNALLIREGLAQPLDEVYGPAGNLEYIKPKRREK